MLARAEYDGALRESDLGVDTDDELVLRYRIDYRGPADMLGLCFDFPEAASSANAGSARARTASGRTARRERSSACTRRDYSRAIPGESYAYPEFQGFFGEWDWLEMRSRDGNVIGAQCAAACRSSGCTRRPAARNPSWSCRELGWTFLHAIPPIGTKFALPEVLGPESQPSEIFDESARRNCLRWISRRRDEPH